MICRRVNSASTTCIARTKKTNPIRRRPIDFDVQFVSFLFSLRLRYLRALVSAFDDPSDLKRRPIRLPRSRILFMYIYTFTNNRSSLPKQIDHFSL